MSVEFYLEKTRKRACLLAKVLTVGTNLDCYVILVFFFISW